MQSRSELEQEVHPSGIDVSFWRPPPPPEFSFAGRYKRRRVCSVDALLSTTEPSQVECLTLTASTRTGTKTEFPTGYKGNFFRTARYCSDGSAVLTQGEDRSIRVYETCTLTHPSPSAITSTLWYPTASAANKENGGYCFVRAGRDRPIGLVDAQDGRLRASYPLISHTEQFVSPSCMAFNPSATKLYCGHEAAIEVFDVARDGREGRRLKVRQSRRSRDGQGGLISALAFSPDPSASGLYAAGSYNGTICFYSEDTRETRLGELDLGRGEGSRGVTELKFHPTNPNVLLVSSRLSNRILAYDVRNPMGGPFATFDRPYGPARPIAEEDAADLSLSNGSLTARSSEGHDSVDRLTQSGARVTQQRMNFDVDWTGRYLVAGGMDGGVRVWDLALESEGEGRWGALVFDEILHGDVVSSVGFHPTEPVVLTCAGSRHWPDNTVESDSESESSSEEGSSGSEDEDGSSGSISDEGDEEEDDDAVEFDESGKVATSLATRSASIERASKAERVAPPRERPRPMDAVMAMTWFGPVVREYDGRME